jgi:hypothetical protein
VKGGDRGTLALAGGLVVLVTGCRSGDGDDPGAPHGRRQCLLPEPRTLPQVGRRLHRGLGSGAGTAHEVPPVFPILLGLLAMAGASSWTFYKLVMAALLSVSVLMVFAWGVERRGAVAGAGLALVTLISAGWIDASRWILSEPLFLAFTFLALWAAERGGGTLPPLRRDLEVAPYDRRAGAGGPHAGRWLLLAGAAAVLALFTRSAGLPPRPGSARRACRCPALEGVDPPGSGGSGPGSLVGVQVQVRIGRRRLRVRVLDGQSI